MDPVTAAIGLGAMAAAAAALAVRRRLSARGRAWRAAAAAAGLRDVAVSSGSRSLTGLAGETDPLQVHLRRYRTSVKDSRGTGFTYGTTVTVSPLGYRSDLQFYHDRLDTPAENGPQPGRGLLVGDPALERAVVLHGSADVACALFDEPTRRLVLALLRGGIEGPGHRWAATLDSVALGNRGLEVLVNESWERGAARLIDVLPGLIAAACDRTRSPRSDWRTCARCSTITPTTRRPAPRSWPPWAMPTRRSGCARRWRSARTAGRRSSRSPRAKRPRTAARRARWPRWRSISRPRRRS
jgi:hypothetical protein